MEDFGDFKEAVIATYNEHPQIKVLQNKFVFNFIKNGKLHHEYLPAKIEYTFEDRELKLCWSRNNHYYRSNNLPAVIITKNHDSVKSIINAFKTVCKGQECKDMIQIWVYQGYELYIKNNLQISLGSDFDKKFKFIPYSNNGEKLDI